MRLLLPVTLAICVSLGHVKMARGDEPKEEAPHRVALSLGHEALQHFARGEFAMAREKFERADRLAHSPVFILYQARADRKMGKLLRARELLERCAAEPVLPSSPDAWRKAVADAVAELEQVSEAIPTVQIVISGGAISPVRIEGNGRSFLLTEPETLLSFDPGPLRIVAEDAAGLRLELETFLTAGQHQYPVELLFPRIVRGVSTANSSSPRVFDTGHLAPVRPYRSGAHAAFLLGGSALLFSAVATTVAVVKADEVKKHCIDGRCRPEDQEKAHSALRWANLATAGVVVGATGVLSGIGLLVVPAQRGAEIALSGEF